MHLCSFFTGSREQAIVYALASASLSQAISKACSLGITTKCSCGRLPNDPPPGTFKWGGCGDNVRFGLSFSKIFTDAVFNNGKRMKRSKSALTNLHNNGAGRTVSTYFQFIHNFHSFIFGFIAVNVTSRLFLC